MEGRLPRPTTTKKPWLAYVGSFESEEEKGGGGGGGNGDLWLSFARREEKEKSLHFPLSYTAVPVLLFSSSFLWESIGTDCSLRGKGRGATTNLTYISVALQEKLSANFLSFPPLICICLFPSNFRVFLPQFWRPKKRKTRHNFWASYVSPPRTSIPAIFRKALNSPSLPLLIYFPLLFIFSLVGGHQKSTESLSPIAPTYFAIDKTRTRNRREKSF